MTLNPLRRIYARLLLSRAKHKSLHGHPRLALKIARRLPAYTYAANAFFSTDSAPPHIQKKRREGFERLAKLFRERSPKTIALTEELEDAIPDLAFVNAHRVPFQYQQYIQDHLRIGSIAEETDGPRVRDIYGNWSYDLGGSYGVNPVSYTHLTLPTIYSV